MNEIAGFQFEPCEKAIIVGSSRNALTTVNFWKKKKGHAWIMINNAWKIRRRNNDFDKICTNIEHFDDPKNVEAKEVIINMPKRFGDYRFLDLYTTFKNMYGDKRERGDIIFFHACYYTLEIYDPKKIGFIGCDMDYEHYSEDEDNSIYGKSDVAKMWNTGDYDKELIIEKCHKFEDILRDRGSRCYNLSTADWTVLPFEKMNYEDF
jgi:hypothetical protein